MELTKNGRQRCRTDRDDVAPIVRRPLVISYRFRHAFDLKGP